MEQTKTKGTVRPETCHAGNNLPGVSVIACLVEHQPDSYCWQIWQDHQHKQKKTAQKKKHSVNRTYIVRVTL